MTKRSSCLRAERRRLAAAAAFALLLAAPPARAAVSPEQPASLLIYPYITADADSDTIVQLTNTGTLPIGVDCHYENANGHCADSGAVCATDEDCSGEARCDPGFSTIDFAIRLTARQPIGWRASQGLSALPVAENEGAIPRLPEIPFRGSLRCVVTNDAGAPVAADVLLGLATIERFTPGPETRIDVAKYAALGAHAVGTPNDDGLLILGGAAAEYDACPNSLYFQHQFEPAVLFDQFRRETTLVLVPCGARYGEGRPAHAEVTYVVVNEFGERRARSTPLAIDGLFTSTLGQLDPLLYDSGIEGTPGGRTLISSTGGGVVGLYVDTYTNFGDPTPASTTARSLGQVGERTSSDVISTGTTPACTGDCNDDGRVDVAEMVNAVAISLGRQPRALCTAADRDGNGDVGIDELMAGVNNLLGGCP